MKYKKGDDIYLKGQITDVSSCSEVPFPYEVHIRDGYISAKEEEIFSFNEPEKPILSKEEAEWLEGLINFGKSCGHSIYNTLYYITRQGFGHLFEYKDYDKNKEFILNNRIYPRKLYPNDLKERFVNALLYGYEVKKEKMYVVFQVATEEYLYTNAFGELRSACVSYVFVEENEEYHFTQQKLEELNYWENPAFEVREVEK